MARKSFSLVILILVAGLVLGSCQLSQGEMELSDPASNSLTAFEYQVFFSDPDSPQAETKRGGPDLYLAEAIRQSQLSVDVAAYDLDLWSIRDALIDAHRRGVRVRVVIDSDNLGEREIQDLKKAGIPVLGDRREGLMHNKFVVIDRQDLWTGSLNLTVNSAYYNNDNLIFLHIPDIAENYTSEFEEMFDQDLFGPDTLQNTPHPFVRVGDVQFETYFSPDDGVEDEIVRLIQAAQHSIDFMAYSFTSDKIGDVMLERSQAGVQVRGVFEEQQTRSNQGSEFEKLRSAGLDVRMDGNPRNMHHKVIVIDKKIVLTGSYNFTFNAENKNDENLLVIHDPGVAANYQAQFEDVYLQANP